MHIHTYTHIHTRIGFRDWKHPRCVSTEWPRCCQQVRTRSSGFRCRTRVTCSSFWPRPMASRWSLLIRIHTNIWVLTYMQIYACSWVSCRQGAVCGFAMCSVLLVCVCNISCACVFWCMAAFGSTLGCTVKWQRSKPSLHRVSLGIFETDMCTLILVAYKADAHKFRNIHVYVFAHAHTHTERRQIVSHSRICL